jgi:hypothetical protein
VVAKDHYLDVASQITGAPSDKLGPDEAATGRRPRRARTEPPTRMGPDPMNALAGGDDRWFVCPSVTPVQLQVERRAPLVISFGGTWPQE